MTHLDSVRGVVVLVLFEERALGELGEHILLVKLGHDLRHVVAITIDALVGWEGLAVGAERTKLLVDEDVIRAGELGESLVGDVILAAQLGLRTARERRREKVCVRRRVW